MEPRLLPATFLFVSPYQSPNTLSAGRSLRNRQAILTVTSVNDILHIRVRWIITGEHYIRSRVRDVEKSSRVKRQNGHIEGPSGINLAKLESIWTRILGRRKWQVSGQIDSHFNEIDK